MFSTGFTSFPILLPFPSSITIFFFVHGFDDTFSKKYNVFLTISSANVFVFLFGDFDVLYKCWLNYYDELIVQVKSVMIFLSQMNLLIWLTFLLGSLIVPLIILCFFSFF